MGPAPGPYPEPQPCGAGSQLGSCFCNPGYTKVLNAAQNHFECLGRNEFDTYLLDACVRGSSSDIQELSPHNLRFGAVGSGEWGQASTYCGT